MQRKYEKIKVVLSHLLYSFSSLLFSSLFKRALLFSSARSLQPLFLFPNPAQSRLDIDINMAPTLLTPPSSGSELNSPLVERQGRVSKKGSSRRSTTSKFTWESHHRRTLLVCRQKKLSSQDITKIFNSLYLDDCVVAGYQDGIPQPTLQSQWQDHKKPTGKAWQKVLASSEAELDIFRREVEEYLVKNPLYVRRTPATRQRPSDARWKASTTNTRVQTFNARKTPFSTEATATLTHVEDTINIATDPLTPPTSPLRSEKPAVQKQKSTQQVSVVVDTSIRPSRVTGSQRARKIFNQSPRTMITAERTRTVFSKQVPIIRATDRNLVVEDPITPAEAHSPVPEVLFRFFDDHSQGVRTQDGEICGRYAYQTCGPPSPLPCDDDRLFVSVLSHLNKDETASELISTTSNLFFAMRLAAESDANPHIYVIRGGALPKEKVFHLRPYHKRFKKLRLFYNGKYRNPSSHEYAIWATIPQPAIIYKFAFADLERHLIGNPYMASIFRIHKMRTEDGNGTILKGFKRDRLSLTPGSIGGIAMLMPHFGITLTSPAVVIARLISEIIRSFVIDLPKTTPTEWDVLGGAFAYQLWSCSGQTHADGPSLIQAKEAFLSGARTGLGQLNWHLDPEKQAAMVRKGLSLGLGVNQTDCDVSTLGSNEKPENKIARFAYKEKDVDLDQDMMAEEDATPIGDEDEDDTVTDDEDEDDVDNEDETLVEDESHETEANTREHNLNNVETPPRSQRRHVSQARETSQSSKSPDEPIIISDCSDDEDFIADTQTQPDNQDMSDIDELTIPAPRLAQRTPPSTNPDNRPRRRSSRRRTQTPPIYNYSRADGVHYISDQSDDDENYTDDEDGNDDMEF